MPVVKTKAIKPKRLKEKEMRLALLNGLRAAAKAAEKDFKAVTATWETEVEWETIISLRGSQASYLVGTNNVIFKYVDEGTKPHMIYPKRATKLRFMPGTRPKTTPGVLTSGPGGGGSDVVYSRGVHHPGTKARKFTELITKKNESKFKDEMHKAMRKAREDSGHKI